MDHKYFEKTDPELPEYKHWMSSDVDKMIDSMLPPWMTPGHEEYKTVYDLNNIGLRCDDFTTNPPDHHILFAGCEITIPQGVDVDKGWASIVYKTLEPNGKDFRNLAYPGASPAKLVSNIFKYFDQYGNPDEIYALMPEMIRDIGAIRDLGVFKPKMYRQYLETEEDVPEHNLMAEPYDLPIHLLALKYLQQMRYLEQYCYATGIKLVWSTWDYSTNKFLSNYKWRYFFEAELPENEGDVWDGKAQPIFAKSFLNQIVYNSTDKGE